MFNLSKIWKNFVCDQRCVNHRWVYVSLLVECSLIGDKFKVSGVVIDQNRMEGTQFACLRLV